MKFTFGFIGTGNMGSALCKAAAEAKPFMQIGVCDKSKEKTLALADKFSNVTSTDIKNIIKDSEYVFIGVKPQMLKDFAKEVNIILAETDNTPVFVSMCAGISTEHLAEMFIKKLPIIRIMPNIPVSVGEGVILYCRNSLTSDKALEFFTGAMSGAGLLDEIDEEKIDAASAVTGCGPAFAYIFTEALSDAAVECGIPRDKAIIYAAKMLEGSAKTVLESKLHPAELKDAVCSPGGTTICGVHALEDKGFRSAVINAVTEAYRKTKGL